MFSFQISIFASSIIIQLFNYCLFQRKKFEIRGSNPGPSAGEKLVYYTSSDEKSKHLLMLCKVTHQFLMAIQPRLTEIQQKEEEGK